MDEAPLRTDLLRLVCASLPPAEAATIRRMEPCDPKSHVAAYEAVIRTGATLPEELRRRFCAQFADAGAAPAKGQRNSR